MRHIASIVLAFVAAGCVSKHTVSHVPEPSSLPSRWQVIPTEKGAILLDTTTGETWSHGYYQEAGHQVLVPYWKAMPRSIPPGGVRPH